MSNNEFLLELSNMLDAKLESALQPIKDDIQMLKTEVQSIKADVQTLKTEVQTLKADVQTLKTEIQTLKTEVQTLKADVQSLKIQVQAQGRELQSLKAEVRQIKLFQENVILPRLKTIESCYLDTYKRYQRDADRMETVYEDVQLLKKVVAEHSERLLVPV